jgi:DNA-binding GntR family transcriptional regulator
MREAIFSPLDHVDLAEKTYQVLKDRILKRDLSPGERVSVDEVARALGVSRTPVNEALKRLASEGLIDILPRRGTFVSQLTAHEVNELFDVRLMIELYSAQSIFARGKVRELLQHVRESMERMRRAAHPDGYSDYMGFMDADRELHLQLVMMAGNEYMTRLYRELAVHVFVARAHFLNNVEDARQALEEHDAVLRAFEHGQMDEVTQALRTHITTVKSRILELLEARGGQL